VRRFDAGGVPRERWNGVFGGLDVSNQWSLQKVSERSSNRRDILCQVRAKKASRHLTHL
jgi:hypothetical protein